MRYVVVVKEETTTRYVVEAETEEDAIEKLGAPFRFISAASSTETISTECMGKAQYFTNERGQIIDVKGEREG